MDVTEVAPVLLPSPPYRKSIHHDDSASVGSSARTHSNTASARNSAYGSDGIFDRHAFRSPINGSESEYEDEDDLISEMPTDSQAPSCYGEDVQEETRSLQEYKTYTPTRSRRSPFRNPASVRGMQLDTTPPHLRSPTRESMSKHHSRLSTGSRQSTPRSIRSYRTSSPTKMKPAPEPKEQPLVLLHVTILPIFCPYSKAILEEIAPPHILQNWKLLRDKVPDTVLERGTLIPHPREEYELLEERLLESLELTIPRILKCGHYHRQPTDDEDSEIESRRTSMAKQDDYDSDADSDICVDCTRHVRDGSKGSNGTGRRRWNIRIYAANGLMRAGAWSAAWREMERVDVEISPWMEESLRRELELRKAQDEEEAEHVRMLLEPQETAETGGNLRSSPIAMDEARRREIYGDHQGERDFTLGEIVDAYEHGPMEVSPANNHHLDPTHTAMLGGDTPSPSPRQAGSIRIHKRPPHGQRARQELPLSVLLQNYLRLLLQDRRNVALGFLSIIVVWLSLRASSMPAIPTPALPEMPAAVSTVTEAVSSAAAYISPRVLPPSFTSIDEGLSTVVADLISATTPTQSASSPRSVLEDSDDPSLEIEVKEPAGSIR